MYERYLAVNLNYFHLNFTVSVFFSPHLSFGNFMFMVNEQAYILRCKRILYFNKLIYPLKCDQKTKGEKQKPRPFTILIPSAHMKRHKELLLNYLETEKIRERMVVALFTVYYVCGDIISFNRWQLTYTQQKCSCHAMGLDFIECKNNKHAQRTRSENDGYGLLTFHWFKHSFCWFNATERTWQSKQLLIIIVYVCCFGGCLFMPIYIYPLRTVELLFIYLLWTTEAQNCTITQQMSESNQSCFFWVLFCLVDQHQQRRKTDQQSTKRI